MSDFLYYHYKPETMFYEKQGVRICTFWWTKHSVRRTLFLQNHCVCAWRFPLYLQYTQFTKESQSVKKFPNHPFLSDRWGTFLAMR